MRHTLACAFALLVAGAPAAVFVTAPVVAEAQAQAPAQDPAAQVIARLNDTLLATLKQGKSLGPKGRFTKLEPAITEAFDLNVMTRFAVGSTWSTLPPAQQQELVKAFTRMTVATYAHNFDSYNNQKFTIDKVDTRGPDKLVHSRLIGGGDTTNLIYRMRQLGGNWKVIDVYYNGTVSSLTGQRSEYAATLKAGGAPALIKKLNSKGDDLLS
jgi:phospholipid transport system substrate-binding protein